jgi:two-component system CheB/CheR fusion protein
MAKKGRPDFKDEEFGSGGNDASKKKVKAAQSGGLSKKEGNGEPVKPRPAAPAERPSPEQMVETEQEKELFPLVGIGASAGGLAALREFFSAVPENSGLAYVVVVHLSPEHKSHLAELLQNSVKMPVEQVTQTVQLQPNRVYVIPPNANLDTIDTHLRLTELEPRRQERAPIDHFFRTLANTHDGRSIGVVLSGTGSDGTLGLRQIKEAGGLTIVQDPNEAEYDGMPRSAITSGLVDLVLPLRQIPQAILAFARTRPKVPKDTSEIDDQARMLLQKIFAQIRSRTSRDFSHYKRSTILRRIARRMQFNHVEELPGYLDLMRRQPEEVNALADDLLITVTNFFRDRSVFEYLEKEIIPKIFENKRPDDPIRLWSVGCATGEEVYSLAILLLEEAQRRESAHLLQVFASDLHEQSLTKAREGYYPGDVETDVSPERLRKFFVKEQGGYRIRKDVRELVIFAPHNLLADPPFSRLDLVACRNLLIYLERHVQRDVIELFHYALKPDGYLVLGTSETLDAVELFRTVDKKCCVYQKRSLVAPEPRLPVFPMTRTLPHGTAKRGELTMQPISYSRLHLQMIERYAPPSILVSPEDRVVHLSEHAGRYLVHPGGELTSGILKFVRDELRIELRAALTAARQSRGPVTTPPIPVQFNGEAAPVVMHVRPSHDFTEEGFLLVIFEEGVPKPFPAPLPPADPPPAGESEAELDMVRHRMQAVIEEYETTQEELRASNEELQSANEELRSTLEELETSKEELQSMNEELQTVNQENRHKVEELGQLSSDLQNLLAATDIATLFLDRELRVMRFTPKVTELFSLRTHDRGRPLSDITHRLDYAELQADAQNVLDRLIPVEREIRDDAGRWYLTRILPYRSADDRIEGVVLTFVDISEPKKALEALQQSEMRLQRLINIHGVGVLIFDDDGRLIDANETFQQMSGYTHADVQSKSLTWRQLTPPEFIALSEEQIRGLAETGRIGPYEKQYFRKDGSRGWMLFAGATLGDGTVGEYGIDITDRKQAEEALREHQTRFLTMVEQIQDYAIFMTDIRGYVTSWNIGVKRVLGFDEDEIVGRDVTHLIFTPEDIARGVPAAELTEAAETGKAANDRWMRRKDGTRFWAAGITTALRNEAGQLLGYMKVMRNQTEQKLLEEELRRTAADLSDASRRKDEFLATLAHELRNPLAPIRTGLELMRFIQDNPQAMEETRETMERQLLQLITLVDDLLDVSRISRGMLRLQKSNVRLSDIMKSAVEASMPMIDEQEHDLHVQIPSEPVHLFASPNRLAQVLSNLLNNAAKFTPAGGQIWLEAHRDNGDLRMSVKDNGIGISPEMRDRIFEMFAQVDTGESRRHAGLGIGLTLAKSIVEMHGGEIAVHSDGPGTGTEFRIRLPIARPSEDAGAAGASPADPPHVQLRVVIADDNESAVNLLGRLVTALGHEVRTARDGQEAYQAAKEFQPDTVLLDLGMPGVTGLEACRRIREQPWGKPMMIVAVTGWGQEGDRRRTTEAGFDEHLVKPVQSADLEQLFARVVARD